MGVKTIWLDDNGDRCGVKVQTPMLGAGMFSRAYRDAERPDSVVILSRREIDLNREVLAYLAGGDDRDNPHLPAMQRLGEWRGDLAAWRTPYSRPLRDASPEARRQARRLRALRDACRGVGRQAAYALVELAEADPIIPAEMADALDCLQSAACNHGYSFGFEFGGPNLAAGDDGRLILRDVLFCGDEVSRIWRERRRAREHRLPASYW